VLMRRRIADVIIAVQRSHTGPSSKITTRWCVNQVDRFRRHI